MSVVIECRDVGKVYGDGPLAQTVLWGVSLALSAGELCAVVGPSGSGKTTLLSILGCMLTPSEGTVSLAGRPIDYRNAGGLVELRRTSIGFVFQHAQLLPFLTIHDNLEVVAMNCGLARAAANDRIAEVAGRLGILDVLHKKPAHVSGGQRQRAAVARAVLHRPPLLLADEPTASLDWLSGRRVVELLVEQARADRSLLITVTHDTRLLPLFERVFHIESGNAFEQ